MYDQYLYIHTCWSSQIQFPITKVRIFDPLLLMFASSSRRQRNHLLLTIFGKENDDLLTDKANLEKIKTIKCPLKGIRNLRRKRSQADAVKTLNVKWTNEQETIPVAKTESLTHDALKKK